MNMYPDVFKISIIDTNHIILHWTTNEGHEKEFDNIIDLIEWCEQNLEEKQGS